MLFPKGKTWLNARTGARYDNKVREAKEKEEEKNFYSSLQSTYTICAQWVSEIPLEIMAPDGTRAQRVIQLPEKGPFLTMVSLKFFFRWKLYESRALNEDFVNKVLRNPNNTASTWRTKLLFCPLDNHSLEMKSNFSGCSTHITSFFFYSKYLNSSRVLLLYWLSYYRATTRCELGILYIYFPFNNCCYHHNFVIQWNNTSRASFLLLVAFTGIIQSIQTNFFLKA